MDKKNKIANILLAVSMCIILVSAFLPIIHVFSPILRYCFAVGAVLAFVAQMIGRYQGADFALKRLYRTLIVSALCYCAAAALLFFPTSDKDWLAFLSAGAVLQVYASFRIKHIEEKNAKSNS